MALPLSASLAIRCLAALFALLVGPDARAQQPAALSPGSTSSPAPVQPIRFRSNGESYSQYSGLSDSLRIVIRDTQTWRHYWLAIHRPFVPPPDLPDIDFRRELIVLASMGTRPTAGHDIRIEGATLDSSRMVVSIRRVAPGNGCVMAAVITRPVDIVRLPATAAPIWFAERGNRLDCSGW